MQNSPLHAAKITLISSYMPILTVKDTELHYSIRYSAKSRRQRITVSFSAIEVVVPRGTKDRAIDLFIFQKRDWVYKAWNKMNGAIKQRSLVLPEHYVHGTHIPFRGALYPLHVTIAGVAKTRIDFSDGFYVTTPLELSTHKQHLEIKKELLHWLDLQLRTDIERIIAQCSRALKKTPKNYRIKHQKTLWGSCSRKGNININFSLIFTPPEVLEYVVVHELCHLRQHNHSKQFWELVEALLPHYKTHRQWLKEHHYVIGMGKNV